MQKYLTKQNIDEQLLEKAKKIKLLALDVDGVLSDGKIFLFNSSNEEFKGFNAKDGQGIKLAQKSQIKVALITARSSHLIEKRAEELGIDLCFHGINNKLETMQKIMSDLELGWEEVAYMGDDLPDLPILKRVGLASTPKDSLPYIKSACHYICDRVGGDGAVRELIDLLLIAQNKLAQILSEYE